MDGRICYTLCMTMRFEWDATKSRINRAKHNGLDFETAARVFNDPHVILIEDRVVEGEERWHAIGAVSTAVLVGRTRLPRGRLWRRNHPHHLVAGS